MGILEIVFNSRKFDLNDDVLMGFDNYFDKKSKDYNSFCLDEEDINPLQNFVAQIKSADSDSVIYVSTYGYEITNSKGEKETGTYLGIKNRCFRKDAFYQRFLCKRRCLLLYQ